MVSDSIQIKENIMNVITDGGKFDFDVDMVGCYAQAAKLINNTKKGLANSPYFTAITDGGSCTQQQIIDYGKGDVNNA
jgi:hypothetical protein